VSEIDIWTTCSYRLMVSTIRSPNGRPSLWSFVSTWSNLMILQGNIFHVDFGFILGRDPKPFPAPMKITKEMVEAMGGFNSVHYQSFKSYCFTAYNILRKSANLILNLFGLMVDANIPDIKAEPDKAVWKVCFDSVFRPWCSLHSVPSSCLILAFCHLLPPRPSKISMIRLTRATIYDVCG